MIGPAASSEVGNMMAPLMWSSCVGGYCRPDSHSKVPFSVDRHVWLPQSGGRGFPNTGVVNRRPASVPL